MDRKKLFPNGRIPSTLSCHDIGAEPHIRHNKKAIKNEYEHTSNVDIEGTRPQSKIR